MIRKRFLLVLAAAAVLLSACQAAATPAVTPDLPPVVPAEDYPAPSEPGETPIDGYPAPGQDDGPGLFNAYPPAPDDSGLERGNFFFEGASLQPNAHETGAFDLYIEGSLPTPCNQLRLQVHPPDQNRRIVVELYSVIDPERMCTQVIAPFSGHVATLSGYPSGVYQVVVDNQTIGEITVP